MIFRNRHRSILLITTIILIFILCFVIYSQNQYWRNKGDPEKNSHIPKQRLVHLDLKGAPPKLAFLKNLINDISQLGATGLLIEYEDMFPFEGNLKVLSARNAYGREELKSFLKACVSLNLQIIPLVQTFGHMEYALKLKEFAHMRENFNSPQAICPKHRETMPFLTSILTQIIEFHREAVAPNAHQFTHIHIGCDEVFQIGQCKMCRKKENPHQIFLEHVTNVANFIKHRWPCLKVIIWDDMLPNISEYTLKSYHLGDLVEPMVWSYSARIADIPKEEMWDKYRAVFPTVWGASAFKGASPLPRRIIPPMQRHHDNNRGWLVVIENQTKGFQQGFQGLTITGWQRYSHFADLCELLPAAIPSLYIILALLAPNGYPSDQRQLFQVMKCEKLQDLIPIIPEQLSEYHPVFLNCPYLGHLSYEFLLNLNDFIQKVQRYLERLQFEDAYLSFYHTEHNFTLSSRMQEEIERIQVYTRGLEHQANMTYKYLQDIYEEFTIAEFIEQQVYPLLKMLRNFRNKAEKLSQFKYWSLRPLKITKEVQDLYKTSILK